MNYSIKQLAASAAIALAMTSGAQAQSMEGLLTGIAAEIIRSAAQQRPQPPGQAPQAPNEIAPIPDQTPDEKVLIPDQTPDEVRQQQAVERPAPSLTAAQARQIAIDGGLAARGARTAQAPFDGYWVIEAASNRVPVLISHDGLYIAQIAGNNSLVYERPLDGGLRRLSAKESHALMLGMMARVRPGALIAFGGAGTGSPIILSAPDCPACVALDHVMRPMQDLNVRLAPTMIGRNPEMVYSRVMCQQAPRVAFESMIDTRGRGAPPSVPNCDMRMEHEVLVNLFWTLSKSPRRSVPALFSADGRLMPLDQTNERTLRASIERASRQSQSR